MKHLSGSLSASPADSPQSVQRVLGDLPSLNPAATWCKHCVCLTCIDKSVYFHYQKLLFFFYPYNSSYRYKNTHRTMVLLFVSCHFVSPFSSGILLGSTLGTKHTVRHVSLNLEVIAWSLPSMWAVYEFCLWHNWTHVVGQQVSCIIHHRKFLKSHPTSPRCLLLLGHSISTKRVCAPSCIRMKNCIKSQCCSLWYLAKFQLRVFSGIQCLFLPCHTLFCQ